MSIELVELERPMSGALPEGWREAVLSDVADVNPETLRASTSPDYAFGYIDISQIEAPGQCAGWTEQTFGDAPSRARRKVQAGDILVSTVRPYLRSFAQVPEADLPLVASTGFAVVRAGADADQQFLYQHILHSRFIEHLTPRMTGSNYPAVSAGDVEAYPIPLPPLDEQRRIAEVLRSVDEAIAAAQDTLDFCESLLTTKRRATLRQFIIEPDDDAVRLGEICELGRGFAFKSEDYVEEGVLNFRVTNVGKPASDLGEKRFLPPSFMTEYEEYRLTGGEIVLVMVGATVGKLGRVPHAVCPALLNQNMWTLTAKKPFDQDLLWHLAHVLIEEKVHGAQGGAYSFLTKKDFLEHRIDRFDVDEIAEAVANLSAIEQYVQRLSDEVRQFHHLKASLMSDLLSGHVRVPA